MIKLAVFDWNGTLLADTTAVVEGANHELSVLGLPPITVKQFRDYYEIPLRHYYQRVGITQTHFKTHGQALAEAFHSFYEPRVARAHTRPGTRQVLTALGEHDIERVILSNHTMEGIYLQLERLKLKDYFSHVLANDVIGEAQHQGKQARLEQFLKEQAVDPAEAVIIGDTIEEVHIGRKLGLKTIAITGGHCSRPRLEATQPDVLIDSLHGLIDAMEKL